MESRTSNLHMEASKNLIIRANIDRTRSIDSAMVKTEKEQTRRRLKCGLKNPGGPKAEE